MNLTRTRRLLKLIGLLQAGRGWNVEALAGTCQVSRRTIFRDLQLLRDADVPLWFDAEQQRYRIPGTYFLAPTKLTTEEALSLIVLCHELGDSSGVPFLGAARSAAVKLAGTLPERMREHVREMCDAVHIQPPARNPLAGHAAVFEQLLDAVAHRRYVRIRYGSLAEGEEIGTKLAPYHLLFSQRSWYAIGRSSLHRSTRTFNVGRIRQLEPLDDTYRLPRGFSVSRYLRNAWHMIPERGRDREVLVRFSRLVAQNVAEVQWHKTQQVAFRKDGTLDFRVTVSGLKEISWWILGYGDQAKVLKPPELRQMVADAAARMVELYERGGNASDGDA